MTHIIMGMYERKMLGHLLLLEVENHIKQNVNWTFHSYF